MSSKSAPLTDLLSAPGALTAPAGRETMTGGLQTISIDAMPEEDRAIERGLLTLMGVAPSIPGPETLAQEIEDARNAEKRGYFLPDEDERVRAAFATYLRAREGLQSCFAELEPMMRQPDALSERQHLEAFAIGFCAACLLSRSAEFVVASYARAKVVHRKLDEPEPRFGIPAKQFTKIFRSLTEPFMMWRFQQSIRFAKDNEEKLLALRDDERMGPVVEMLLEEKPQLIEFSRRTYFRKRLRYWIYAYIRGQRSGFKQVMFALFELGGRALTKPRNPFHLKRVTPEIVAAIQSQMQPGDVLVTREDDALINYVLPGFWPHTALYIGTESQRRAIGLEMDGDRHERARDPACVLEAKKDGVRFRTLDFTLKVDSFALIRPRLTQQEIRESLLRAIGHEGKHYDFECDLRRTDRLVCTELVYRAYHAVGGLQFAPIAGAGRLYLTAEQILDYALDGSGFDVVAVFGVKGMGLVFGDEASEILRKSYRPD